MEKAGQTAPPCKSHVLSSPGLFLCCSGSSCLSAHCQQRFLSHLGGTSISCRWCTPRPRTPCAKHSQHAYIKYVCVFPKVLFSSCA